MTPHALFQHELKKIEGITCDQEPDDSQMNSEASR